MNAAAYNMQRISKMRIKVVSSKLYFIGWNESKSNGCKSAQMRIKKPKKPEWT